MTCDICLIMNRLAEMGDELETIETGIEIYDWYIGEAYNALSNAVVALIHAHQPGCTNTTNLYWHNTRRELE